jgi:hypothetical protein
VPRKGYRNIENEMAGRLYYRWEFIRRNKSYQADQAKFVSLFGQWFKRRGLSLESLTGYNHDRFDKQGIYRGRIGNYFMKNIAPYMEAFDRKWGVNWPCSPSFTFELDDLDTYTEKRINYRDRYRNSPVQHLRNDLRLDADIDKLAEDLCDFVNPKRIRKTHFGETSTRFEVANEKGIIRSVFIKHPELNSKNDKRYIAAIAKIAEELYSSANPNLKSIRKHFPEVSIRIRTIKEKWDSRSLFRVHPLLGKERNYELFHRFMRQIEWPKKQHTRGARAKRLHLKKYAGYLQVWNLKNSHPTLTWTEIAKRLYPRKFKQYSSGFLIGEKNPAVQLAMDKYRSAQRLIAGDFQEIR